MANLGNITVNVSLNGPLDIEKIAEEVKASIRKEIERVGVKVEPLKVGDYAKITGNGDRGPDCPHNFEIGETVVVEYSSHGAKGPVYVVHSLTGRKGGVATVDIVKATNEEVTESKRKLAEKESEAKWAKIGRKPNEFKKGDIVRVDDPCGAPLKQGDLVEVNYASTTEISVSVTEKGWRVTVSELITPVEARFDQ